MGEQRGMFAARDRRDHAVDQASRRDSGSPATTKVGAQGSQSTATSSASQSCRILRSASRPILSVSTPRATLSIESKLTTQCCGTGSSPGSRTTSLGKPRTVVVHGAMTVRRRRGIAASRDNTTTGLRPMSGSSHHQTSPRAGNELTARLPQPGTTRDHPTRRLRQGGGCRRRHKLRRLPRHGVEQGTLPRRHRQVSSPAHPPSPCAPAREAAGPRWC